VGLRGHMPLAKMIDEYIARRTDLKPETLKAHKQTRDKLVAFFGADKPIGSITAAEAADYKRARAMVDAGAYVSKQIQLARQYFNDAVDRELINKSPFAKIKGSSQKNPDRQHFVARELVERATDKAIDLEWRLIIAFWRYGGVRVLSEILALEWPDIAWNENRIHIRASKTEHHEGRKERDIPLFPELRALLLEARAAAAPDATFVIMRYRSPASNFRTQFLRTLEAAGVAPWPKLFQNMRSTRQTELTEIFPEHVVCAWMGNTEKVAKGHYLQVTPVHFNRAAGVIAHARHDHHDDHDDGGGASNNGRDGDAKSGAACAGLTSHDAAPQFSEETTTLEFAAVSSQVPDAANICKLLHMGAVGFEPTKA
jgi:integrase